MGRRDHELMAMAARLAVRGHGGAEPNPLVGCVIADAAGNVVGEGFHRRCGGPHAEIEALRSAGNRAGATAYVTLEPCAHHGRTRPCTEALETAGIRRVVIARRDPSAEARGGVETLREGGIDVEILEDCPAAVAVSDPFVHRVRTGLPWVVAKWAQTLDGRIATRTGESRWISHPASRRLVHRERGRVDVILTGIGTVHADDPRLTARGVRRRRVARRVVVDPTLEMPERAKLVTTAGEVPTSIACGQSAVAANPTRAGRLCDRDVELIVTPDPDGELSLDTVLRELVGRHDATHVLVESGGRLLGRLFRAGLVCEAWVFLAPLLLGDEQAIPCVTGGEVAELTGGVTLALRDRYERKDDLVLRYAVT